MAYDKPYLEVTEANRKMSGKGAPRDTLFGVLGHTKEDPMTRSLGGLMITTTKDASPKGVTTKASSEAKNTEKHLLGGSHKTALPGVHYGQVPFAGMYMKAVGSRV
jgi:hypothetical protein